MRCPLTEAQNNIQAITMQLNGDRTPLACRRRRLGDDFLPHTVESLKGDGSSEAKKCSASRRARQAGGPRSPFD
jgi:hypothetical protein